MQKLNFGDYLITFLLIANSGLPFFTNNPELWIPVGAGLSLILLLLTKGYIIFSNRYFLLTLFLLTILTIGQSIIVEQFELRTTLTLFLRWTYPFITIAYLTHKFPHVYIKIIYYLSIISFAFYFPSVISQDFEDSLYEYSTTFSQESKSEAYEYNPNILVYTIKTSGGMFDVKRNSGAFWEPGGFGSFLILAFVFNLIITNRVINKKNVIFIIAMVTTWSTATWIALFVILFLFLFLVKRQYYSSYLYLPIIAFLAYISYTDIEIFNTKINTQVEYLSEDVSIESSRRTRIVSALVDLQDVRNSPFFGLGRSFETRFGTTRDKTYLEHRNNGLTDFLVKYGIPFFLIYFYFIYKGFLRYSSIYERSLFFPLIALIALFIIGFSQGLFQRSVFLGLFYLHIFFSSKEQLKIYTSISNSKRYSAV